MERENKPRLLNRLSRIEVRVVSGGLRDRDELARILAGTTPAPPGVAPAADGPASPPL